MSARATALRRLNHVFGENCGGHSPHAARHGCDGANDRFRSIKIHVADQFSGSFVPINANIDDRLALANRIRANRARASNRGNNNVGRTALGS